LRFWGADFVKHGPEVYRKLQSLKADAQQGEIEEVGNPNSCGFRNQKFNGGFERFWLHASTALAVYP